MAVEIWITKDRSLRETVGGFMVLSSTTFFREYWAPACDTLGLGWVSLFSVGIMLKSEEYQCVLEELEIVRGYFEEVLSDEDLQYTLPRIDYLVRVLNDPTYKADYFVYVG